MLGSNRTRAHGQHVCFVANPAKVFLCTCRLLTYHCCSLTSPLFFTAQSLLLKCPGPVGHTVYSRFRSRLISGVVLRVPNPNYLFLAAAGPPFPLTKATPPYSLSSCTLLKPVYENSLLTLVFPSWFFFSTFSTANQSPPA